MKKTTSHSKSTSSASNKSVKKTVKKKTTSKAVGPKVSKQIHDSMFIAKLPGYFLITCVILALIAMIYILWPFLTVIFVAAVLAITFYPLYRWVLRKMPNWERSASFLTCVIVVLITVVPLTVFSIMVADEANGAYLTVKSNLDSGVFDEYLLWEPGGIIYDFTDNALKYAEDYIDIEDLNIKEKIITLAQDLSGWLADGVTTLFASLLNLVLNFLFMLFALYYFFKDGEVIIKKLTLLSPLPHAYEFELFKKVGDMVNAIMIGVFLTAVVQGIVGGIGYAILGISSSAFWGMAIGIFSLVPVVGTAVVWVPTVIVLLILGSYGSALFLLIWGAVVIGSVDNVLRPYLIGGKARTYPLLTFFVILGGIFMLNFKGIIVGPLVLMLLMSILHIYEAEYTKVLNR